MNKNITFLVGLLVLMGIVGFLYATRATSVPTQSIESVGQETAIVPDETKGEVVYRISQENSTVEYEINEKLKGEPKVVLGKSNQIAGDINVSAGGIAFGTITINARTFVTDNEKRDAAVNRYILKTEDAVNEFIVFKTTSVIEVTPGTEMNVSGDLTISGITKPATFSVTGKQEGDVLTGVAKTTIKRSDFNIVIPTLDFIADVPDEFAVTATIVANKVIVE